ncbi:MAG: hypothetical protein K2L51_00590, partial [Clostridiales bacterium]|nr:hypothetical protein [Clostridiales bacterium]
EEGITAVYFTLCGNAWAQNWFALQEYKMPAYSPVQATVKSGKGRHHIKYGNTVLTIDNDGQLLRFGNNGKDVLCAPMRLYVHRAPVDNDRNVKAYWEQLGTTQAQMHSRISIDSHGVTAEGIVAADCRRSILDYKLTYTFVEDGVLVDLRYEIPTYVADLPRVGLRFAVPDTFKRVRYLGIGGESTVDRHSGYDKDVFEEASDALYTPYIKPQENGNRYDTDFAELSGDTTLGIYADTPFSLSLSAFSQEQTLNAWHNFELSPYGKIHVILDAAMRGVGSNSCGPELADKYKLKGKGRIRFLLRTK